MKTLFSIQTYMAHGVARVVGDSLRTTSENAKEAAYIKSFAAVSKKASRKRSKAEKNGEHIPPFLIASITSSCNLHCRGSFGPVHKGKPDEQDLKAAQAFAARMMENA